MSAPAGQSTPEIDAEVERGRRDLLVRLVIFVALLAVAVLIGVNNNGVRAQPIYLFLLLLTTGLGLQFNLLGSASLALVALVAWIGVERAMGTWTRGEMLNNLVELAGLLVTTLAASFFHTRLKVYLRRYAEGQHHLAQMEIEDKQIGLLRPPIGRLRLGEEVERAYQQQLPLAVLLLSVQPIPGKTWSVDVRNPLVQAVATQVKDAGREADVPFALEDDRIALVLLAADLAETQKVLDHLTQRLREGRYLLANGQTDLLSNYIQVRYGFAVFLGQAENQPDMLAAAELSLRQNIDANEGPAFQNVFIDWVTVGEAPGPVLGVYETVIR
jgi:GGDEF domain-containing protein